MKSFRNLQFIFSILFFCFFATNFFSQQSILLNQSSYNLYLLSPAAAGLNQDITTNCHYKKNWLGIAESPELMQLTIDGALPKNKIGLGLNLANEKTGIFSKTYLSGTIRYRIKLNSKHHLSFGLSAGFQRQMSDFSKIKADAPEEFAQWPQQQAVLIPDASFGIAYTHKKLFISLAATQLLQQNYSYKEPMYNKELQYKTVSQFIIAIQNTFTLKPETWFYTPHLTLRTPQGLPVQFDFVNTISYKNKFLVGIGYRYYYAFYANLGFCITEKLRILYSYEYSQGIQNYTRGGHEIGLTFGLPNKNTKVPVASENVNTRIVDEIYERLDKQEQQIEVLAKKVDSLDKNLNALKSEIDVLKSKQVDEEEINSAIEKFLVKKEIKNKSNEITEVPPAEKNNTETTAKQEKYKVINPRGENEAGPAIETSNSNYKIVLAVYISLANARDYQKFIKRELDWDSKLIQLNDHPKKFIYVCTPTEFNSLKEALIQLKTIRKDVKSKAIQVTRGEAWILQTLTN